MSTLLVTEIITVKPIELFSRSIQYKSTLRTCKYSINTIGH